MKFAVSVSRQKQYTEEGVAFVEATNSVHARKLAMAMVLRDEVEFQIDAGSTTVVPGSLMITAIK